MNVRGVAPNEANFSDSFTFPFLTNPHPKPNVWTDDHVIPLVTDHFAIIRNQLSLVSHSLAKSFYREDRFRPNGFVGSTLVRLSVHEIMNNVDNSYPVETWSFRTMKCLRLSQLVVTTITFAILFFLHSGSGHAQAVYSQGPASIQPQVYRSPQGGVQGSRYYARQPMTGYGTRPSYSPQYLTRFRGGYVGGRNYYWPTGRNIPMAKPWLSAR